MRPSRQNALASAAGVGLLITLVIAPLAGGAPSTQGTPSIAGYPGFNSVLTCKPGEWSPDAQTFEYAWAYESGGDIATGQKLRVEDVGYQIVCRVTAKDSAGDATTATSAAVTTVKGRTSMKLKAKKVQHKKVTLTGTIKPRASLDKDAGRRNVQVVAYRVEKNGLYQLFGKQSLKANGKFKIVAPDQPGKNRYKVNFNPTDLRWEFATRFVTVRLKKR